MPRRSRSLTPPPPFKMNPDDVPIILTNKNPCCVGIRVGTMLAAIVKAGLTGAYAFFFFHASGLDGPTHKTLAKLDFIFGIIVASTGAPAAVIFVVRRPWAAYLWVLSQILVDVSILVWTVAYKVILERSKAGGTPSAPHNDLHFVQGIGLFISAAIAELYFVWIGCAYANYVRRYNYEKQLYGATFGPKGDRNPRGPHRRTGRASRRLSGPAPPYKDSDSSSGKLKAGPSGVSIAK